MNIKEIVNKKQKDLTLSHKEIEFAIMGYVNGSISKQDMTVFLKSVYNHGLCEEETFYLNDVMLNSGKILSFGDQKGVFADKHSTGGVSDSTTLIIAPIIACAGVKFLKMSGRKLGHTGGTVDKLECFDGYKTDITMALAKKLVKRNNACLISQTEDLAPADKYIYKLRDETDTVMNLSLIASSIMSKKLASGNDIIVLDVKTGTGAFMKTKKKAEDLAKLMVKIGKQYNKKTVAIVTDMNQPLGYNVGSLLETMEAIEVLEGKTGNLYEISLILASKIIEKACNINFEEAKTLAETILKSGTALKKLKKIISAQKGSLKLFDKKYREKILLKHVDIPSKKEGYISAFDLELLGNNTRKYCSAGNLGIKTYHKLGDYIKKGDVLITLYGDPSDLDFSKSFHVSKNKPEQNPLVYEIIE